MATTTKFATSASGTSWTNPSNVLANDGVYATYTIAARTTTGNNLTLSNFGFDSAIPAGSIINSVTLEVEHKVSTTASIAFLESAVAVGGVAGTFNSDSLEPTTDTIRTYTNVADPSGGAWTRADLLDGTFTVLLRARSGNSTTSCTYSWDYATVTVDYTAPVNATATVTGTSATSATGTVTATGTTAVNATATVTGTSATSSAGTVTASGTTVINATASVTGASSTSAAQSVSGKGDALKVLIGAEATSEYGFVNAEVITSGHANVSGEHMHSGIADITASGDGLTGSVSGSESTSGTSSAGASGQAVSIATGIEATAYVATITATGEGSGSQNAVANVTPVQATATAGNVTASAQAAKQPGGRFRGTTARIDHKKDATAKVVGVDSFAIAGRVFAIGSVNARVKVKPARAKTAASVPVASGIQNPTDEQLLMMLLA